MWPSSTYDTSAVSCLSEPYLFGGKYELRTISLDFVIVNARVATRVVKMTPFQFCHRNYTSNYQHDGDCKITELKTAACVMDRIGIFVEILRTWRNEFFVIWYGP